MRKLLSVLVGVLFFSTPLFAQRTVTGKVTDDKDSPVANASVQARGTKAGTVTKTDGTFSLVVPASVRILVISSVGMEPQEVNIAGKTTVTVSLKATDKSMEEVVVVAYGTQKKSELNQSLTKVSGDKVAQVPLTSVDQILQGKAAGVQSSTFSGQPGANQQVRIRGIGSFSASSQPLYVIDGIQINSGDLSRLAITSNVLATLNNDDIESITILKDAAAVSIYGARGANGVILITTKKGKAGKTQINFSTEVGSNSLGKIPDAARPLNANEWLTLFKESYINAGGTAAQAATAAGNYGDGSVDIDWLRQVTRNGTQQQYNLSASGGDSKTTFYVSGSYFKQAASTIGSDLRRITSNIAIDHSPNSKLSFGINLKPSYTNQNTPLSNGGFFGSPTLAIWFLRPTQNPYNQDGSLNITSSAKDFASLYNPLWIASHDQRKLDNLQIFGDVHASYKIANNLKFTTRMGLQYDNLEEYNYNNPFHGDGKAANGRGYAYYTRYFLYDWVSQFDYNLRMLKNKDLSFDATAGYEAINSKGYFISSQSQNYSTPILPLSVNASTVTIGNANESDYSFLSAFSRVGFNYKSKYFVSGTFRRDGSSRFSAANLYGNFAGGSVSWALIKENFMAGVKFLSDLKLRLSYGETGNAEIGNYNWRQTFGYGANYNGLPGGTFSNIGNADLTWEKSKQTDLGVDVGLFKNRVNIVFDWYKKKSDALLFNVPLPPSVGFTTLNQNIGAMQNKGVELTINATAIETKNFTWDISWNFTHNKNEMLTLPAGQPQIINGSFLIKPGLDIYSFYLKQWAGVDPATGNPLWYVDATKSTTTTSYGAAQRVASGQSALPKFFGGFSNTFTYKTISLAADFYYNFGNYVQDGWSFYLNDEVSPTFGKYAKILARWQKPGDITNVPKLIYGSSNSSTSASTRFLYKGDFVRLRNITLTYTAPAAFVKELHLSSLRFYVRGTNIWTKTYDKNLTIDPEQGINSQSNLNIIYNKAITGGFTLGF
ncbi:MAG TPA: TonB-dependent receptor [Chitinophagaceae bacterium]|nr:TonB-dependent receptor [Chitinophagaceae bacterium]